jgi:hypothetical protein
MRWLWASRGIDHPTHTVVLESAHCPNRSANQGHSYERVNSHEVKAHSERLALLLRSENTVARRLRIAMNRYSPTIDGIRTGQFHALLMQPIMIRIVLEHFVFDPSVPGQSGRGLLRCNDSFVMQINRAKNSKHYERKSNGNSFSDWIHGALTGHLEFRNETSFARKHARGLCIAHEPGISVRQSSRSGILQFTIFCEELRRMSAQLCPAVPLHGMVDFDWPSMAITMETLV